MKHIAFGLIALLACTCAQAASQILCSGDLRLQALEGRWMLQRFADALASSRSWHAALSRVDSGTAALRIDQQRVHFNLAWHEADPGSGHCVKLESGRLWARPGNLPASPWLGPYRRTGPVTCDEAGDYLGLYFTGCFTSETRERWCLSSAGLSIDGSPLSARLQMDLSEGPLYGTAFAVEGRRLPFLVFVPRPDGWAIFEDDWTSAAQRIVIDPDRSKPWRRLKR